MKTPDWKPQNIGIIDGFKIVLDFEKEHMCPKSHFVNECGWSDDEYNEIKNYYWFSAKVITYKGVIECGSAYLGGCCHKNLKCVMGDKKLENILGGYLPQLIEEAIDEAKASLAA